MVGWGWEREMLVNYTRQVSSRDSTSELRDGGFLEAAKLIIYTLATYFTLLI